MNIPQQYQQKYDDHQKWLNNDNGGSRANLSEANLSEADLSEARYNLLSVFAIEIGKISRGLCLELMRRDAAAHPNPEKFQEWADGGYCPLRSGKIERMFNFRESRDLWEHGPPQLSDWELWVRIAEELEIKII